LQTNYSSAGRPLWIVGIIALLIRAIALWMDRQALMFETGGLDAAEYLTMIRGFWAGDWPNHQPFFWAPGYPLFLGMASAVSDSMWWFKLLQIVLGAGTVVLIGRLAFLLFGCRSVAFLAACIAAVYGPLVYYDLQLSPATLDTFLVVLLLVLSLDPGLRQREWLWCFSLGCVAAASVITRGATLLALPIMTAWLWRLDGYGSSLTMRFSRCVALALPVIGILGAVALHNWRYDSSLNQPSSARDANMRSIVPVSNNLGINFLLGNVPHLYEANRIDHPLCFVSYGGAIGEPFRHGYVSSSAQNRYLFWKGIRWIARHPVEWLGLLVTKAAEMGHGQEISRDTSIYAARLDNSIMAVLFWNAGVAFPSGILIPLALAGMAWAFLNRRGHPIVWLFLASQAVFVLAFFVTTRYRLPLCALAIPFAAYAATELGRTLRLPASGRSVAMIVLLGTLMLLCNRGLRAHPQNHHPFEHVYVGAVLNSRGETDRAAEHWRAALRLDPGTPTAHFNLAQYYSTRGEFASASSHYEAGLRRAPTAYLAHEEYAQLLIYDRKPELALEQLLRSLALAPSQALRDSVCELGRRVNRYLPLSCP
jgi:hypothetical protein